MCCKIHNSGKRRMRRSVFWGKRRYYHRDRSLSEQISRHYLYNSLQIIAGLCDTEPAKAKEAVIAFSDYLRINLDKEMLKDLVGFDRELENTKVYIELEHLSGSRPFDVEFRIGTEDFLLPPLTLQPVVENAIRYGADRSGAVNRIVISTSETEDGTVIEVSNTVPAEPFIYDREQRGNGIALQNITARLGLLCGGTLSLETADGVTKTIINIPKTKRRSR